MKKAKQEVSTQVAIVAKAAGGQGGLDTKTHTRVPTSLPARKKSADGVRAN